MDLSRTRGEGPWTDAIYDAAHYMEAVNCGYILAEDWGISYGLLIASSGRLNVRDIFWLQGEDLKKSVENYIRLGNVCFVSWRVPTGLAQMQLLRLTLAERGQSLILEKTFYQADGTPSIDLYRTTAKAHAH
jgi:hypothetical protein